MDKDLKHSMLEVTNIALYYIWKTTPNMNMTLVYDIKNVCNVINGAKSAYKNITDDLCFSHLLVLTYATEEDYDCIDVTLHGRDRLTEVRTMVQDIIYYFDLHNNEDFILDNKDEILTSIKKGYLTKFKKTICKLKLKEHI